MKFNIKEKNYGSICCFQAIDNKFLPKREADHASYRKYTSFDLNEFDYIEWSEDGEILSATIEDSYPLYDEDGEEYYDTTYYKFLHTITGKYGDTGYVFGTPNSQFWYEKHGVYRWSGHWGKVGQSDWTLSDDNFHAGYANYSAFIPKNRKGKTIYELWSNKNAAPLVYRTKKEAESDLQYFLSCDAKEGDFDPDRYSIIKNRAHIK